MGDLINYPVVNSPPDDLNNLHSQINLVTSGNSIGMPFSTNLKDIAEAWFAIKEGVRNVSHRGSLNKLELMREVMKTRSELTQYRLRIASLPQDSPDVAKEAAYLDMIEIGLAEQLKLLGLTDVLVDKYA